MAEGPCTLPGAWRCLPAPSMLPALPQQTPSSGDSAHRKKLVTSHGDELELIRPSIYRNVARQLNISLHSETVVTDAFLAVAAQIFAAGITWGKVVSLYSVAAGLAVDCVRQAQPAMVHALVDCLGEFVRKTLVTWLRRRGGWTDVLKCVVSSDPGFRSHWLVTTLCSFGRFLKAAFFVLLPER
ncbi:PREDICTED: bcl-2-related ovarian killer protein [Miniopterus natalensis]|uniref:bcl-2-related ovarian killer protein n=1 Tax=Miniopterus natalensis TaxID=291302 RepID=UPI0007A6AE06|nr:PREDICTED: bcl-2-related ovarian killer protein [Miniopterus natalensis]